MQKRMVFSLPTKERPHLTGELRPRENPRPVKPPGGVVGSWFMLSLLSMKKGGGL